MGIKIKNLKKISCLLLILLFISYCNKEKEELIIKTIVIKEIKETSAKCDIQFSQSIVDIEIGVCYSTNTLPTISNSKKSLNVTYPGKTFSILMEDLKANNTYYVRSFYINKGIPVYGNELIFKIDSRQAVIKTLDVTEITAFSAFFGLEIVRDSGYNIHTCGVCWGLNKQPSTDDSVTYYCKDTAKNIAWSSKLQCVTNKLSPGTSFYYRAFAINSSCTSYGEEKSFITKEANGSNIDIDGNAFRITNIGGKIWMADNLNVTHYNDGWPIETTSSPTLDISKGSSPKYQWAYNGDENIAKIYGRLYTKFVAIDKRICPVGWHVPVSSEWDYLFRLTGGQNISGGRLKDTSSLYWNAPNTGANNLAKFNALPSGYRDINGAYLDIGKSCTWWCIFANPLLDYDETWYVHTLNSNLNTWPNNARKGFSIRCVKN